MRPQIMMELAGVGLLHHQDALDAVQCGGHALGLHRGEQAQRDQARLDPVRRRPGQRLAHRSRGRAPGDDGERAVAFDLRPMVAVVEIGDLIAALVELRDVMLGRGRGRAARIMRQAVGGVLPARGARQRHGRHPAHCQGIALVIFAGALRGLAPGQEGNIRRPVDDGARLAQELVREHDGRRLHGLGQMHRPLCREQAVGDRQRRHHHMRGVAVQAVDGDVEVGLLRLGRDAGGRPAAHDVDDDERNL